MIIVGYESDKAAQFNCVAFDFWQRSAELRFFLAPGERRFRDAFKAVPLPLDTEEVLHLFCLVRALGMSVLSSRRRIASRA